MIDGPTGPDPDDLAEVQMRLAAAGITPSEPELAALAAALPGQRRQLAGLHAVECGDGPPASMLRAAHVAGGGAP